MTGHPRPLRRPLTESPSHTDYPDLGRAECESRTRPLLTPRPVYQPHYCHTVLGAGEEGRTLAGMARRLGVTKHQVVAWMEDHQPFREAVFEAQARAQTWWEDRLRQQALEGNASSTQFAMKNMFPDQYRDRREMVVEERDTFEIEYIDMVGYQGDDDDD